MGIPLPPTADELINHLLVVRDYLLEHWTPEPPDTNVYWCAGLGCYPMWFVPFSVDQQTALTLTLPYYQLTNGQCPAPPLFLRRYWSPANQQPTLPYFTLRQFDLIWAFPLPGNWRLTKQDLLFTQDHNVGRCWLVNYDTPDKVPQWK